MRPQASKWRAPRSEPAWRRPKGPVPPLAQAIKQVQADTADLQLQVAAVIPPTNTGSF